LSNSFIGNDWRAQMEKEVQAEANTPADKSLIKKLIIQNSGNSAAAQISQIQSMIAQHVNAILIDAASPTSLNNVIAQAHAQGIVVVSFDNLVTSPYAIKQNYSNVDWGIAGAKYLAKALHGKGSVVMLEGIAGTTAELDRERGVLSVFKQYPGIKVVSRVNGNWSESGGHSAMTSVLASGKQFNAIWSSGDMAGGAVSALVQAHHSLKIAITDAAFNNFLQILHQDASQGLQGLAVGDSDWSGAAALNTALKALQGQKVPMNIVNPISTYTGKAYNPKLPSTFNMDYTSPVLGPKGQLTVQNVLSGK
jgi:ribose transport system substrate-binding protein